MRCLFFYAATSLVEQLSILLSIFIKIVMKIE